MILISFFFFITTFLLKKSYNVIAVAAAFGRAVQARRSNPARYLKSQNY